MPTSNKKKQGQYNSYLKYSGLATQMVITIGLAIYLGWRLDKYLEYKFPVFTIVFMLISTVGIFYKLIKAIQKDNNADK